MCGQRSVFPEGCRGAYTDTGPSVETSAGSDNVKVEEGDALFLAFLWIELGEGGGDFLFFFFPFFLQGGALLRDPGFDGGRRGWRCLFAAAAAAAAACGLGFGLVAVHDDEGAAAVERVLCRGRANHQRPTELW